MKKTEDQEQIAVMQWARLQSFEHGKIVNYLHHSPNGGSRHAIEGAKFKKNGRDGRIP